MKLEGKVEAQTGFRVRQRTSQLTDNKGQPKDKTSARDSEIVFQPPSLVQ